MADAKITELTAYTTPISTDVLPIVDVTNSTTKKITTGNILAISNDGWLSANETWTYASASTITVPSGAASKYQKGDRIKLTQTTVKYFVVVGVADTVLTVTGGSDYTVANAAITANYYSHQANPIGYPHVFNYTPTLTGGVADLSGYNTAIFSVDGQRCFVKFGAENKNVTGSAGEIRVTLPITISKGGNYVVGSYRYFISSYSYGRCEPQSTYVNLYKGMTAESWAANETGIYIFFEIEYWI